MELQDKQLQGRSGRSGVFAGESSRIKQAPRGLQGTPSHRAHLQMHMWIDLSGWKVNGSAVASL